MKRDWSPIITIIVALISGAFLLLNTYLEYTLENQALTTVAVTTSPTTVTPALQTSQQQSTNRSLQVISITAKIGGIVLWFIVAMCGFVLILALWRKKLLQVLIGVSIVTAVSSTIGIYLAALVGKPIIGAIIGGIIGAAVGGYFGYGWWKGQPKRGRKLWV